MLTKLQIRGLRVFTLFLAVGSLACHKIESSPPLAERPLPAPESLRTIVQEMETNPHADPCDRRDFSLKMELSKAVEERAEEIKDYQKTGTTDRFHIVPMGPINFKDTDVSQAPRKGWIDDLMDWPSTYEFYKKIRNRSTNSDWLFLSHVVRSLILDDQVRLRGEFDYSLDEQSEKWLNEIENASSKCLSKYSCEVPNLSFGATHFLQSNPFYSDLWLKLHDVMAGPAYRQIWIDIHDRVHQDIQVNFAFNANPTVKRNGSHELVLPLNPGPFKGVEDTLAKIIEETWKSPQTHVKILWNESPENYTLVAGTDAGQRSKVSWGKRQVTFYPDTKIKSISHELGHVLGFQDKYFPDWDPAICAYHFRTNEEDIMSEPETGLVTIEEWAFLKVFY